MDNWYTSAELFEELLYRVTYACGTVCMLHKGTPSSFKKSTIKPLQSSFARNSPLLLVKWHGQETKSKNKPVSLLSMIHEANELLTTKKDKHGNHLPKPEAIFEYTKYMSGVDLSDQYMAFHMNLHKSIFNMVLLNAYILNKMYGSMKLSHSEYMEYIANYMIQSSLNSTTCVPSPNNLMCRLSQIRLSGRHFISQIPKNLENLSQPTPMCKCCNFTKNKMAKLGYEPRHLPQKTMIYWCEMCKVPLCMTPCFEIFHTKEDYQTIIIHKCLPDL